MHEFSLMADLMRQIEDLARAHDASKVIRVNVKLGALSHITADHFREHFESSSMGTVAEGARLDIEVAQDVSDPQAQDILLKEVEVAQ